MLTRIRFLTAGESHGKGLVGIIEGIPAGLYISEDYINLQLSRRQAGHGRSNRMKIENDVVDIISGVRDGKTLGSPISIFIRNNDYKNWQEKMSIHELPKSHKKITLPRPGHADLAGIQKYGFDDIRNVIERSSARETAMRVALGSICKKLLSDIGIVIYSRVISIGSIKDFTNLKTNDYEKLHSKIDQSPLRCVNKNIETKMIKIIDDCIEKGDSIGGEIEIHAAGIPYGLGDYTQWDKKLHGLIASLLLSINGFKSLEIGSSKDELKSFGSNFHDEIFWKDNQYVRGSNHAGGIEGGMTNAQPIIIRAHMKPIPTLRKPLASIDIISKEEKLAHKERTDSCAVPAASIIAEHMLSFALVDSLLSKFGGDSMLELKNHLDKSAKY